MHNIEDIINELFELETIKTWSLIVTVFGDLDGVELTGKELRRVMEPLGVKAEATRVALHRLKKDGWVISKPKGREVTYLLSEKGRSETNSVYDDIYSPDLKYSEGWQFLVLGDVRDDFDKGFPSIRIGRHLALVPRSSNLDVSSTMEIQIVEKQVPIWFQIRLQNNESLSISKKLLTYIDLYPEIENEATELQKLLFRLLILHHWRKIALRPSCWAHIGLVPDGLISSLHKSVTRFLNQTQPVKLHQE